MIVFQYFERICELESEVSVFFSNTAEIRCFKLAWTFQPKTDQKSIVLTLNIHPLTVRYTKIGGFDLSLHGWGLEDVLLYRKYASSSSFSINRAPVPSLFHDWHEKHCEKDVEAGQVKSCVKSKSVNEGSQVQLGELLFMGEANRKKIGWG